MLTTEALNFIHISEQIKPMNIIHTDWSTHTIELFFLETFLISSHCHFATDSFPISLGRDIKLPF